MLDKIFWPLKWAVPMLMLLVSCQPSAPKQDGKYFVCTTGMIQDAVARVAGPEARVEALMGPGVDPHLYKATQGDLSRLTEADMVFYNGLHLEGKMGEVLEKLGRQKPVVAVAESLDSSLLLQADGAYDPHVWFDVDLWSKVVLAIGASLAAQYPDEAAGYQERAAAYASELQALHEEVKASIASIPEAQRVLITAHDAFGYFGRAYQIEVRGLQGISTISEFGLRDVTDLVRFLTEKRIKAVFVESSIPARSVEAVVEGCAAQGHQVAIGGTLYSDAMGAAGSPEGTYTGMVQHNVQTIVSALK